MLLPFILLHCAYPLRCWASKVRCLSTYNDFDRRPYMGCKSRGWLSGVCRCCRLFIEEGFDAAKHWNKYKAFAGSVAYSKDL